MFEDILHPTPETRNTHSIYRIGTFIKYFISENNKRLLEDSLLTVFQDYFYDENPDVIIERMKKLDISYLLVDLNAATIDQDPGKRLTSRYEDLLFFMTDP